MTGRKARYLGLLAALLTTCLLLPAAHAGPTYTEAGSDPAGDWGAEGLAPLGEALGQDLIGASIGMPDEETLEFRIGVTNLPPAGATLMGLYVWGFKVEGEHIGLVSCGIFVTECSSPENFVAFGDCDIVQQPVPDPTTEGCPYLAEVSATFDAATGTISIPVPSHAIGAHPGTTVKLKKGFIMATPYVQVLSSDFHNFDAMKTKGSFRVPR